MAALLLFQQIHGLTFHFIHGLLAAQLIDVQLGFVRIGIPVRRVEPYDKHRF